MRFYAPYCTCENSVENVLCLEVLCTGEVSSWSPGRSCLVYLSNLPDRWHSLWTTWLCPHLGTGTGMLLLLPLHSLDSSRHHWGCHCNTPLELLFHRNLCVDWWARPCNLQAYFLVPHAGCSSPPHQIICLSSPLDLWGNCGLVLSPLHIWLSLLNLLSASCC